MRRPGESPCSKRPLETPREHFDRCGPWCTSTRLCEKCDVNRLCSAHRVDPDGGIFWVDAPGTTTRRKGRRGVRRRHGAAR